jgi:hypothetical protein
MSRINDFSYEQTVVLRTAVDEVLRALNEKSDEGRRRDIARIVLTIFEQDTHGVDALVARTLERIREPPSATPRPWASLWASLDDAWAEAEGIPAGARPA